MKLIGPRSVASVIHWMLGIINGFVMVVGVPYFAFGMVVAFFNPDFGNELLDGLAAVTPNAGDTGISHQIMILAGLVATVGIWWVINRLRRIFTAVNDGNAFEPANVQRLRGVGLGLIGIQISGAILAFSIPLAEGTTARNYQPNLSAWLGILVVFMLAEVFRQGAAMRDDQQMTV